MITFDRKFPVTLNLNLKIALGEQYCFGYATLATPLPPFTKTQFYYRYSHEDLNKLRHTNRSLDESSYNPISHKAMTIKTLTRQVQLACDTPESLRDENRHFEFVFYKTTTVTMLTLLDSPDKLTTDREQFIRSNAPTSGLLTFGKTGRNLNTRLTEHKRARKNGDANNHIAVHHQLTNTILTGTPLSA